MFMNARLLLEPWMMSSVLPDDYVQRGPNYIVYSIAVPLGETNTGTVFMKVLRMCASEEGLMLVGQAISRRIQIGRTRGPSNVGFCTKQNHVAFRHRQE